MKYSFKGFTDKANEALNFAISSAEYMGHTYIGSEHLLLGILKTGSGVAAAILNSKNVTARKIEELIDETIGSGSPTELSPNHVTPKAKRVLEKALESVSKHGKGLAGTEHILMGILSDGDNYAIRFLKALNIDVASLTFETAKQTNNIESKYNKKEKKDSVKTDKNSGLEKYGHDLTLKQRKEKLTRLLAEIRKSIGLFKFYAVVQKTIHALLVNRALAKQQLPRA